MTYAMEFHNISRSYGGVRAVGGVNIAINDGEFFSVLGPSGSSKTTCLRLIAGFGQLSGGAITVFGKQANELPSWERDVNTISQDYALFPRMSILDNVAYGLMVKSIDKKQCHARAREALDKVALGFVYGRKPSQLSGGRRQRVAIARALVSGPHVLLLDEPLGTLDFKLREQIQLELKKLQQSLGITFIFVTRDQRETLSMSNRVAVFNNDRIEQVGPLRGLYMRPRTPFVASSIRTSDVFDVTMSASACGLQGMFSLHPGHICLNDARGEVQITRVIQAMQCQGATTRFELKLADGEKLLVNQANLTGEMLLSALSPGQQVMASWSRNVMVPLIEER